MSSFSLDARGLAKLEEALGELRAKSVPYAIRQSLNDTAFYTRRHWTERQMPKDLILRNKYTQKSARVDKAQGLDIDRMQATLGSVSDYMDETEEGHTRQKSGKHGVAIPTSSAAGQGKSKRPRTRPVQRANYLAAINLSNARKTAGSRQRRNMVALQVAAKSTRVALLELPGKRRALFRVTGFTSKGKFKVKMLYDLSRATVKSKPVPTMKRSLDAVRPTLPLIHRTALEKEIVKQLERKLER